MIRRCPSDYQTENWLLDNEYYREKVGSYSPFRLPALTNPVEILWVDGFSTYNGLNDKIPREAIGETATSLRLITVEEITLRVFAPGEAFGNSKRRVQGQFNHAGHRYKLRVTDPKYERRYLAKLDGTYRIGNCCLAISLGEEFQKTIFKLIASIIEPGGNLHRV